MNPPPLNDLTLHAQALKGFARALCQSDADAEDVSQDVLLAALEGPRAVRSSWPGWLRGVGRHVARARHRSEGRRRRREADCARPEAVPSAAERAARLELEERLVGYVRKLPESQSEALYLRYWEGLPPRVIAARLGVSTEAVKTRLKRALARLRARLDEGTPGGRDEWMTGLGFFAGGIVMKKGVALVGVAVIAAGLWTAWPEGEGPAEPTPPSAPPNESALVPLELPEEAQTGRELAGEPAPPSLPDNTSVITGRVLDRPAGGGPEQDVPAVGVEVHFSRIMALGESPPTTKTDDTGAFRFEIEHDWAGRRSFRLFALRDEDQRSATHEVFLTGDEPRAVEVVLVRHGHGGLSGTTVDLAGNALGGVDVRVAERGDEVAAAVSDESGTFHIAKLESGGDLEAELAGWTLVETAAARQNEDGSWRDVRLVLGPSGVLRVKVEDSDGEPLEGLRVSVAPSPAERYGHERSGLRMNEEVVLRSETLSDGEAVFADVWCGLKLRVGIFAGGNRLWFEHERDGVALPLSRGEGGRPILVSTGGDRALVIRMASPRRIAGRVVTTSDTPLAGAHVNLRSVDRRAGGPAFVRLTTRADDEGLFELDVRTFETAGTALLSASDSRGHFFSWSKEAAPLAGSLVLDLSKSHEEVTLVVEPTLAITGKVVGPDDEGIRAKLRVTPVGGELVQGLLPTGFYDGAYAQKDGEFTLAGLPDGAFDVFVEHEDHAPVLLEGVAAGTHGLVVRLDQPPVATVEIEVVVAPDCEVDEIVVLRGTLRPWDGSTVRAPTLPAQAVYSDPFGWPESALGLWYGSEGESIDIGSCTYNYWPIQGTTTSIGVHEGFYWFGAKGRTKAGHSLFPVGTGLVEVTPGVHRLRFELRPTGSVEGRVTGIPAGVELHAAIAQRGGRLVPLDVRRDDMACTVELGAAGGFLFQDVPEGDFELRIGTRAELSAGENRGRRAIAVRAGEALSVELEL